MAIKLPKRMAKRSVSDTMTLVEHLSELRRRLIISIVAVLITGSVAFGLYNHILHFLTGPYCQVSPLHCRLYVTGPLDGFSIRIKIAAYGGLFLASPVLLWEIWRFITPGLNPKEKRYAIPFIVASISLFTLGATVAYYTFPHALRFLGQVGGPDIQAIYSPSSYLSLITLLMVAFGVTFEFPVVLVSLELAGVVGTAALSKWRRWAIVIIVALAAVITPSSDPFSMLALAVPMWVFYEASIIVGKLFHK